MITLCTRQKLNDRKRQHTAKRYRCPEVVLFIIVLLVMSIHPAYANPSDIRNTFTPPSFFFHYPDPTSATDIVPIAGWLPTINVDDPTTWPYLAGTEPQKIFVALWRFEKDSLWQDIGEQVRKAFLAPAESLIFARNNGKPLWKTEISLTKTTSSVKNTTNDGLVRGVITPLPEGIRTSITGEAVYVLVATDSSQTLTTDFPESNRVSAFWFVTTGNDSLRTIVMRAERPDATPDATPESAPATPVSSIISPADAPQESQKTVDVPHVRLVISPLSEVFDRTGERPFVVRMRAMGEDGAPLDNQRGFLTVAPARFRSEAWSGYTMGIEPPESPPVHVGMFQTNAGGRDDVVLETTKVTSEAPYLELVAQGDGAAITARQVIIQRPIGDYIVGLRPRLSPDPNTPIDIIALDSAGKRRSVNTLRLTVEEMGQRFIWQSGRHDSIWQAVDAPPVLRTQKIAIQNDSLTTVYVARGARPRLVRVIDGKGKLRATLPLPPLEVGVSH